MKVTPAEAKAIKFVLLLIVLSGVARWLSRPEPVDLSVPPAATQASAFSASATQKKPDSPIDPNTASLRELDQLPGIGEATARKIIAKRPYTTLDDLGSVIGQKRARGLASRVTLQPATLQLSDPALTTRTRNDAASTEPINLNQATASELEQLPGIGPALARRLIARRDSLRGFRDWSQVDSVNGVGPALLKKLKAASTF